MEFLWNKLTEWLKEMLVGGVMSNLTGLFDSINEQVADIAGTVGTTPQAWNSGVFSMVQSLSNNVVVPIAGVLLAIVMAMELIQMVVDRNNMNDFDVGQIIKWVCKSFFAIILVTSTWDIVMGIFDLAQTVVNNAAGVIISDTSLDLNSVITDMEARLMEMDIGPLFSLWIQSALIGILSDSDHLHFHYRLWPHDRDLSGHIHCLHSDGNHGQQGMEPDGAELPAQSVCVGLPGVLDRCVCRCVCRAGAVYRRGNGRHQGHLDKHRLHGTAVLHAVQDQQPI